MEKSTNKNKNQRGFYSKNNIEMRKMKKILFGTLCIIACLMFIVVIYMYFM